MHVIQHSLTSGMKLLRYPTAGQIHSSFLPGTQRHTPLNYTTLILCKHGQRSLHWVCIHARTGENTCHMDRKAHTPVAVELEVQVAEGHWGVLWCNEVITALSFFFFAVETQTFYMSQLFFFFLIKCCYMKNVENSHDFLTSLHPTCGCVSCRNIWLSLEIEFSL